jgi:ribosomal protein L7/L12
MEPSGFRVASATLDDSVLAAIRRHLAQGNKIEAIKTLRAATGVDLAAAKNAVEAIESGVEPRTEKFDLSGPDGERIKSALLAGKKSEAIRIFREITGSDLKTSHDAVVAFARHLNPAGADTPPESTKSRTIPIGPTVSRSGGQVIRTVLAIAVIALLVVMLAKFTI